MAIRKGRVEDIPAFEYIDKLCFPQTIRYSRFDFIYYFFKNNVFTLVCEEGRRIQAFMIADVKSTEEGHIISIDVHPNYRRKGLGRNLMDEAEKIFMKLGIQRVTLEVHESNVLAQLFYSDMGYRLEKKLYNYYHSGHGLQMSKMLVAVKPEEKEEVEPIVVEAKSEQAQKQMTLERYQLT
ncbi:MAG: GNAT family N-acetyltransferase [Thermoplasmata archaeon]|nr:MAG: GNAT family N-acetyltransferase [Thermoplasmata archaeon]